MFPPLSPKADAFVSRYFEREILPVVTPIAVDAAHPFPRRWSGSRNLVVSVVSDDGRQKPYGVVLVHPSLPRVVNVPEGAGEVAVLLEHVIARHLRDLFPNDAISTASVSPADGSR